MSVSIRRVYLDDTLLPEVIQISENHAEHLMVTVTMNVKKIEIDGDAIKITTYASKKEDNR